MQVQVEIPAFDHFSGIMAQADLMTSPAELHGILVGFICIGQKFNGKFWLDTVLKRLVSRTGSAVQQRDAIIDLYDKTCRQLNEAADSFELLLPSEQQPFEVRAEALSQWCQGFLYGFRLDENMLRPTSDELKSALRCIVEIAKLDFSKIEISALDQPAYLAAMECVRVAVITAHNELFELAGKHDKKNIPNRLH